MNPETTPERGKGEFDTTTATRDANERWQRTAVAAFYRAQARGFAPGGELDDWLAAERELGPTMMIQEPILPAAEPLTQRPDAAPGKSSIAKSATRRRNKSERGTGRNIGGMA